MTVGLRSKIKLGVRAIKGKVRPVWRSVSVVRKHRKGVRQTMGRQPCCDKVGLKKGPWTEEEDKKLITFILTNGQCCWRAVPKLAGLLRCGKSCRLRWTNYLRPDLKRGLLSDDEEQMVIELHSQLGNRWSKIASHLPGRTDNEIKNHWNTHIKKKLRKMGIDPLTHKPLHEEPCLHSSPKVPAERVEGKNTTSTSATCSLSPSSSCSSEKTEEIQLPRMEWPESAYLYGLDDLDGWDFTSDHLLLDSFGQCQRAALDQESWKFELF